MRVVLTAWASVRGSCNVPNAHLPADEWQQWRAREPAAQRQERRIHEAVARITWFAAGCFNNFWAVREKNRRTLRIKLAFLRKARTVHNWARARGLVARAVWKTRTVRHFARRPKRIAAVLPDAIEQMRQEAAARLRTQRVPAPVERRARLHLLTAARAGPVLTAMLVATRPSGDG